MVIVILDHIPHCYSNADGDVIHDLIVKGFSQSEEIVLSFQGVDGVSSSFVNSALIRLLDDYEYNDIKARLKIINSTKQINQMIKSRFIFEAELKKRMIKV